MSSKPLAESSIAGATMIDVVLSELFARNQDLVRPRDELEEIAARLASGATPRAVIETLVHRHWSRDDAAFVVARLTAIVSAEMRRKARRQTLIGACVMVASLTVTLLTAVYGRKLGFYSFPLTTAFVGLIIFARGISGWIKFRRVR